MSTPQSYSVGFQTSSLVEENLKDSEPLPKKFLENCVLPSWKVECIYSGDIHDANSLFSLNHSLRISGVAFSKQEYKDLFSNVEKRMLDLGFKISATSGDIRNVSLPVSEKDLGDLWGLGMTYENESVKGLFQIFITRTGKSSGVLIAHLAESPTRG